MIHTDSEASAIEECVDELEQAISVMPYSEVVLAASLRLHLAALLRTLVEVHQCSRSDARQFVLELEREALGVGE